jgi:hypothetical protein
VLLCLHFWFEHLLPLKHQATLRSWQIGHIIWHSATPYIRVYQLQLSIAAALDFAIISIQYCQVQKSLVKVTVIISIVRDSFPVGTPNFHVASTCPLSAAS